MDGSGDDGLHAQRCSWARKNPGFCAGEELCLLHVSEVPQALHTGEVTGLGHSPERLILEDGWHKRT